MHPELGTQEGRGSGSDERGDLWVSPLDPADHRPIYPDRPGHRRLAHAGAQPQFTKLVAKADGRATQLAIPGDDRRPFDFARPVHGGADLEGRHEDLT